MHLRAYEHPNNDRENAKSDAKDYKGRVAAFVRRCRLLKPTPLAIEPNE
jgi:hypothetical protein